MFLRPRSWLEPHLVEALDSLRFELTSQKNRLLSRNRTKKTESKYLHLGCGPIRINGFLNCDFYYNKDVDFNLDVRFPLPFDDGVWRGVYSHHLIEHLSYDDVMKLMRECHRTLAPGGIFRMVVPNMEVFLRLYSDSDPGVRKQIFELYPSHAMKLLSVNSPLEMVDYVFRDNKYNRHLSSWDWETAQLRLREIGFSSVCRSKCNESADPSLAGHDREDWSAFSLYVEAVK